MVKVVVHPRGGNHVYVFGTSSSWRRFWDVIFLMIER
jgi:hypothetical protein